MTDYGHINYTEVGPTMKSYPLHALCLLFACSRQQTEQVAAKVEGEAEQATEVEYNLPGIWAEATLIEHFTQAICNEDMEEVMENAPKASTKVVNDTILLTYPNAHFRCDQAVQGYVKRTDNGYSVLIQPTEMNPFMVAKCDCGYTLEAKLPNIKPNDVRVFHRGDNHGGEAIIREITVESK